VSFYLQLAAGGSPVDMNKVTYTVATQNHVVTFIDANAKSAGEVSTSTVELKFVGPESEGANNLLEKHEMVMITIPLTDTGNFEGANRIQPNDRFNIDIKPDIGAALSMTKTAPAAMVKNANYELY